jgi:hypothetical protein
VVHDAETESRRDRRRGVCPSHQSFLIEVLLESTARIDRTAGDVVICRAFMRSVLLPIIDRKVPSPTASTNTARGSTAWR